MQYLFSPFDFKFLYSCLENVKYEEFVVKESNEGNYKYLIVQKYPMIINNRYGGIPNRIYVRSCYEDLYEICAGHILNKNLFGYPVFLITGVPGIGKSLFLFYFIYRYIRDDRFTNNRFALEFEQKEYHVFTKVNNDFEKFEVQVVNKVSSVGDDIVLSDIKNPVEPGGRTKRLFIFSSPNPARYKETIKNGFKVKYTMPTWDENELMSIADKCGDWYQRFILVGGVPRDIFSTDKNIREINDTLQTAI